MKQIPLAIGHEPPATFDNFVAGANADALAHLRALALPAPPVYLWGPAASGKTHLLQALAVRCRAGGLIAAWFDAADPLPWELQPAWALVVVDRCDELSPAAQHAAFVLFEAAAAQGVQWLAAGRQPPVDLPLRDDLRTRLGWGPVFALQPLGDSETRAALRREADQRGIFLSDEVMDYLLSRLPRDLGHLMLALDRLDEFGLAKGRRVTLPLLRQMFSEEGLPEPGA
jgi:DnaA-homolog protein